MEQGPMESDVLKAAAGLTETIRDTHRRHHFSASVRDFVRLLSTVTDYPVTDFSADGIGALKTLAEDVIEHIEVWLSTNASPADQQLASAVYEIRRLLEEIDRWRHHYLRAQ